MHSTKRRRKARGSSPEPMVPVDSIETASGESPASSSSGLLFIPGCDTYTNVDGQRRLRQINASGIKTNHLTSHPTSQLENVLTPHSFNEGSLEIPSLGEPTPEPPVESADSQPRSKRPSDYPMREWTKQRDQFLAEFMRLEGRGNYQTGTGCPQCLRREVDAVYRCTSCSVPYLVCESCVLSNHCFDGLHILEFWNGSHFVRRTLWDLGFRFQLGHAPHQKCDNPHPAPGDTFTVIDHSGIHQVALDFCGCDQALPHFIQLLRFGWYPATVTQPSTAATFGVLKLYHMLSYQGKISCHEFYAALSRLTDNTGLEVPKTRYREFFRMSRQFCHLKMLKRAARGNIEGSAASVPQGSCAVACPACPRPGVNLPEGWENESLARAFLYCLFLAIDANFRLKRKAVSSDAVDPSLNNGASFFVNDAAYKHFIKEFGAKINQDASTCSNHSAVNNDRSVRGLAASGVGAVDCSRHEMKRPMAVGDLQKGERYVNMDFLWLWSLQYVYVLCLLVSYNIACQWSINLFARILLYPQWAQDLNLEERKITFLVPKFHLPAHIPTCRTRFSHNFTPGVGATDSESIERQWAGLNEYATSTREMGPGARRDILDDAFGDWNWRKVTSFASSLLRKIKNAVPEMVEHRQLHEEFTEGVTSVLASKWEGEVLQWENDPKCHANPYESRGKALSVDHVRRTLAEQEGKEHDEGSALQLHEEISASQLISQGIELEDQQRRQAKDSLKVTQSLHPTENERTKVQLKTNTLRRKIEGWIEAQHAYIPALRVVRQGLENDETSTPYQTKLFLPSDLLNPESSSPQPPSSIVRACDKRLYEIEWQLRCAQATDSLDALRDAIRVRAALFHDKQRFQRGQHANTRSQGLINRMGEKVNTAAERYRSAQAAIWRLGAHLDRVGYDSRYPILLPTDIRNIQEDENEAYDNADLIFSEDSAEAIKELLPRMLPGRRKRKAKSGDDVESSRSESRRTVSWIWRRVDLGGEGHFMGESSRIQSERVAVTEGLSSAVQQDLHEGVRIEWCKSRARAKRWEEEVELIQEEMRRVQASFAYQANEWDKHSENVSWNIPGGSNFEAGTLYDVDDGVIQGRAAYARQQAAQFRALRAWCARAWANVPSFVASLGNEPLVPRDISIRLKDAKGLGDIGNDEGDGEDEFDQP